MWGSAVNLIILAIVLFEKAVSQYSESPRGQPPSLSFARLVKVINETNNILTLHSQITPLARITNALYLEHCFLSKCSDVDSIFTELINLDDVNLVKQLEGLNMDRLLAAFHSLKATPDLFPMSLGKINKGLTVLENLKDVDSKFKNLPSDAEKNVYFDDLKKLILLCQTFRPTDVPFNNALKAIDKLMETGTEVTMQTLSTYTNRFREVVKTLEKVEKEIGNIGNVQVGEFEKVIAGPVVLDPLLKRIELYNQFKLTVQPLNAMQAEFGNIDKGKMLENVIKNYEDYIDAQKIVDFMTTVTEKLRIPVGLTKRDHTSAFREGVINLVHLDKSLDSKWFGEKVLKGSSVEAVRAALHPMRQLIAEVSQVENSLYAASIRHSSASTLQTVEVALSSLIDAKKTLKDLAKSIDEVDAVVKVSKTIKDERLEFEKRHFDILKVRTLVETFLKKFKELRSSSEMSKLKDLSEMKKLFTVSKKDVNIVKALLDGVKQNQEKINSELKNNLKLFRGSISGVKTHLKAIKSYWLTEMEPATVQAVKWSNDEYPKLEKFIDELKSRSSKFEDLRAGIAFFNEVRTMKQDNTTFKTIRDIADDFSFAVECLKRARKEASSLSQMKQRDELLEAVFKFKDGAVAAKKLGEAAHLTGEMGKALARKAALETISANTANIDAAIGNVKNKKMRDEILKGWTDSRKVQSLLDTLAAEVETLDKDIPVVGAADVNAVGPLIAKLNAVKSVDLDILSLQKSVSLLNKVTLNSKVTETSAALSKLTELDLNFATHTLSLTDFSTSFTSATKFLNNLSTKKVPPTNSPLAAAQQTNQQSSGEFTAMDYVKVVFIVFLVLLVIILIALNVFSLTSAKGRLKFVRTFRLNKVKRKCKRGNYPSGGNAKKGGKKSKSSGTSGSNESLMKTTSKSKYSVSKETGKSSVSLTPSTSKSAPSSAQNATRNDKKGNKKKGKSPAQTKKKVAKPKKK